MKLDDSEFFRWLAAKLWLKVQNSNMANKIWKNEQIEKCRRVEFKS